jgi:hypothetical protein
MTGFLRSHFCRFLRRGESLNRFFYSEFDSAVLGERRARNEQSKQECGEPSTSGLRDPKEEPVEEMILDLENHRYNFYLHPLVGEE